MHKTIEYTAEVKEAFDLEANGLKVDATHSHAQWARMMAAEMKNRESPAEMAWLKAMAR
jgi:hypothetical protein